MGFKKNFQDAFSAIRPEADFTKVATVVQSTSKSETYGWLGKFPKMRDRSKAYLKMLRADPGYWYAGSSPIHNPDKEQIHFNLAFATNHPTGMETMRKAEFGTLSEYDRTRFNKKRPPQDDLFGSIGEDLEVRGPYLSARDNHLDHAGETMLNLLKDHPGGLTFERPSALTQQYLYLRRPELNDVLVDLTSQGKIADDWKVGRQKSLPRRTLSG